MKNKIAILICLGSLPLALHPQTVTDIDGHVYNTVTIGTQTWLKENLRVTHYNDGTPIPWVADSLAWASLTTAGRCYYDNDSLANDSVYGVLYNWYALGTTLCPAGWHVSTDGEWTTLQNFLGGDAVAGGKMKEAGTAHWISPNQDATNSSGFTGLPGGMRGLTHLFQYKGENGLWWSSSSQSATNAWSYYLWYMYGGVDRNPTPKKMGMSVRCVMNAGAGLGTTGSLDGLTVYPNPAGTLLTISRNEQAFSIVLARVYDSSGKLVWESPLGTSAEIWVEKFRSGIYFLQVTSEASVTTQKVLISH